MKATLADIASRTGLSVSTVSRVIKKDSRISPETIKLVSDVAEKLNYRTPTQKRMAKQKEMAKRNRNRQFNIFLLFPYPFAEYKYTLLDLLILETLENCVQKMGWAMQVTRLTEDGRIPDYLLRQKIDAVVMKSYQMPAPETCPLLYQIPLSCVFGFVEPKKAQVWSASDNTRCVNIVWEEMIENRGCREIIIPVFKGHENEELWEKLALLKYKCDENAVRLSKLIIYEKKDNLPLLEKAIGHYPEKSAVFFPRIFQDEFGLCQELLRSSLQPGGDFEMITALYDCNTTLNPAVCWIDLKGREIVRSAFNHLVNIVQSESFAPARILIQPELVDLQAGSKE